MLKIKTKYAGGFLQRSSHKRGGQEGTSSRMSNRINLDLQPEPPGLTAADYAIMDQRRQQQNASTAGHRSDSELQKAENKEKESQQANNYSENMTSSFPDAQGKNFLPSITSIRSENAPYSMPTEDRRKAAIQRILNRNTANVRHPNQLRLDTRVEYPSGLSRQRLLAGHTPVTAQQEQSVMDS